MNKTFKVVFNKARGALMVVNEATSSVQKKGTKTVVVAAVATMIAGVAGTAMADEPPAESTPAEPPFVLTGGQQDTVSSSYSNKITTGSGAIYNISGDTEITFSGVYFGENTAEL